MKIRLFFPAAMAIVIGLSAASLPARADATLDAAKEQPAKKDSKKKEQKPVNKNCPVEPDNAIDSSVETVTYKGKVVGFCCEDCVKVFKKNPDKYAKKMK